MGEKFHRMLVCDSDLVAGLSRIATEAVRREDGTELRSFHARHAGRRAAIDAFRVPLDAARLAQAQDTVAHLDQPFARALRAVSRADRAVGKTAQSALFRRVSRVARLIEIDAPAPIIATDLAYATAALEALDTADLSARHASAGLDPEPDESSLVEDCLGLCVVPGHDDDIGLDDLWDLSMDAFILGAPLASVPTIRDDEEPTPELLGRVVERFGVYSGDEAREVLLEQWLRFCGSFGYYVPPVWGTGAALEEAAAEVRALPDRPRDEEDEEDEEEDGREAALEESARELARELEDAARAGHAVVEWVMKT